MKNKLYYLLFLLYVLMFIFILYINGVFTGEVTSLSNLLINVSFLVVIGIMFMVSSVAFGRLNILVDALERACVTMEKEHREKEGSLWEIYRARKKVFAHDELDYQYARYQKRMASYQTSKGLKAVCDLEEFINNDIVDRVAMSHYNSAVSGTLTGLGILGTFLGLSMGLGSFDGNDIYTISDNVGPLLEGMKVAFHTSVYGIFFSLVFNFIYRSIMADAYDVMAQFHEMYSEYVKPQVATADENSKAMLIYQANMANSMKTMVELLKGNAMEQTQGVERIVNQFVAQMSQTMGTEFDKLGRALNYVCKTQEQSVRDYQAMEEAGKELQAVNRSMQRALEGLLERQEQISRSLQDQQQRIDATCNMVNNELSNQLYTYHQMRDTE